MLISVWNTPASFRAAPEDRSKMKLATYLATTALAVLLAGCATSSDKKPSTTPTVTEQTSQTVATGVGGAVESPLNDLNLNQKSIPEILRNAREKPYDVAGLETCPALASRIRELDFVLGPDVDVPKPKDTKDDVSKGAAFAADAAVDTLQSAAQGLIPLRGLVRKISGAEKRDREAKAMILAGFVRRAYLKAMSFRSGCPPIPPVAVVPATPPPRK